MVGSRCVLQGCSNRRNKAAGLALRASPTDRTRDLWVRFVRLQCENFLPQPLAKFVICSVHFEENCFTRTRSTLTGGAMHRHRRSQGSSPVEAYLSLLLKSRSKTAKIINNKIKLRDCSPFVWSLPLFRKDLTILNLVSLVNLTDCLLLPKKSIMDLWSSSSRYATMI